MTSVGTIVVSWEQILFGRPVIHVAVVASLVAAMLVTNMGASVFVAAAAVIAVVLGTVAIRIAARGFDDAAP